MLTSSHQLESNGWITCIRRATGVKEILVTYYCGLCSSSLYKEVLDWSLRVGMYLGRVVCKRVIQWDRMSNAMGLWGMCIFFIAYLLRIVDTE